MSTPIAGLLVPLDMFRISQLAEMFGQLLASKARNILDAELVVTRHPEAPLLLMQISGSISNDNPATFWRENVDLAQMISRAMPRQVIMFFADPGPTPEDRREGFIVAQQGQMLAADDASADRMPADAPDSEWPVAKLCQQLRIPYEDLKTNFAGGAQVSVKLVDSPPIDDQALLQQLFSKEMEAQAGEGEGEDQADPEPTADGQPAPPAPKPKSPAEIAAEDAKRRAREHAEEAAAAAARAAEIQSGLRIAQDDLGLTVAPEAELSEPDHLSPFIVAKLEGEAPEGISHELTAQLQGKRIDVAVKVDFLSEVFIENSPLSKPQFMEISTERELGGKKVRVAEVLGPRLGYGSLISTGSAPHVFVSRKPDLPLPEALIAELLGS